MIRKQISALVTLFIAISPVHAAPPARTLEVLSPVYKIDKVIKSMEGPQSSQPVYLMESQPPELLWITGFKTDMVGADGKTPSLPEFMCHVNLDYNPGLHAQMFNGNTGTNARLLTLSQGQIESRFPKGFGLPIMSNEPVSMNTQVLNFNLEKPNLDVRHKVTFEYLRDSELKKPMKALFNTSGFGMALLEGDSGHFGIPQADEKVHGPSCLPGESAPNARGGSVYQDGFNRKFTGHWVVKPGREVNHTNITQYMNLPFDTTLHYAAVHLHPFSESLELRDITVKKTIFKSKSKNFKDKIGLTDVSSFTHKKGVPLYKNHQYELVSTYNNTTSVNQDSMAVMMLFLHDKNFKKPVLAAAASMPSAPAASAVTVSPVNASKAVNPPRMVLKTELGDMTFKLYPDVAPKTVEHILELVRSGAYDTTHFYRVEPGFVAQIALVQDRTVPMTPSQSALIKTVPAEFSAIPHRRGVLSMARETRDVNSGSSSFSILLGDAPHLDGQYTVFGELETGVETLSKIERVERAEKHAPRTRLSIKTAKVLSK